MASLFCIARRMDERLGYAVLRSTAGSRVRVVLGWKDIAARWALRDAATVRKGRGGDVCFRGALECVKQVLRAALLLQMVGCSLLGQVWLLQYCSKPSIRGFREKDGERRNREFRRDREGDGRRVEYMGPRSSEAVVEHRRR